MALSQEQIETCKRIEKKGGPQTQEEIELYQQYQQEKNRFEQAKKTNGTSVETAFSRAAHGMNQLEKELSDLEEELNERQIRLDYLLKEINYADQNKN